MEDIKNYTTLISTSDTDKQRIYGVWSLTTPIMKMVPRVPALVETTLLPFRNKIVFTGFFAYAKMEFDKEMIAVINAGYRAKIKMEGIKEKLP
jgi:hypothetical protein